MADREFRFNTSLLVYNTKRITLDHSGLPCHLHIKHFHRRFGERVCRLEAQQSTAICFHTQLYLLIQWQSKVSSKIDASSHSLYIYIYIYDLSCSCLTGKLYSSYVGSAGMLLYINETSTMGRLKSSLL